MSEQTTPTAPPEYPKTPEEFVRYVGEDDFAGAIGLILRTSTQHEEQIERMYEKIKRHQAATQERAEWCEKLTADCKAWAANYQEMGARYMDVWNENKALRQSLRDLFPHSFTGEWNFEREVEHWTREQSFGRGEAPAVLKALHLLRP